MLNRHFRYDISKQVHLNNLFHYAAAATREKHRLYQKNIFIVFEMSVTYWLHWKNAHNPYFRTRIFEGKINLLLIFFVNYRG